MKLYTRLNWKLILPWLIQRTLLTTFFLFKRTVNIHPNSLQNDSCLQQGSRLLNTMLERWHKNEVRRRQIFLNIDMIPKIYQTGFYKNFLLLIKFHKNKTENNFVILLVAKFKVSTHAEISPSLAAEILCQFSGSCIQGNGGEVFLVVKTVVQVD